MHVEEVLILIFGQKSSIKEQRDVNFSGSRGEARASPFLAVPLVIL